MDAANELGKKLIDDIIYIEWEMFQNVNEGKTRVDCQNNPQTFGAMRRAQFLAWSHDALASYLEDLKLAIVDKRNLLVEKYIYMMKYTEPHNYEILRHTVPEPDENVTRLAAKLVEKIMEQTTSLFKEFPYIASLGRPQFSAEDISYITSLETYQRGEFVTYSEKTLSALSRHIDMLNRENVSFAGIIMENTVKTYGYPSLADANAAAKKHLEKIGHQMDCCVHCSTESKKNGRFF